MKAIIYKIACSETDGKKTKPSLIKSIAKENTEKNYWLKSVNIITLIKKP